MKIIEKLKNKNENINSSPPVTIAFFGDSVTQGCFELYKTGERGFETEFRVEEGYHAKLRHMLELCYPKAPINMIYAGLSGGNITAGLERIDRDVIPFHPDLTIISFGLNDCGQKDEGLSAYGENLKKVIKKLKDADSEIIFLTPNLMADEVSPEESDPFIIECFSNMIDRNKYLEKYMDLARKICKEESVALCDCHKKWQILKENGVNITRLLANHINHPIGEMHNMFATSLLETMFEM